MQKENHAAHGHYVFLIMDLASRKGCPFLEKYVFYYINIKDILRVLHFLFLISRKIL